MVKEYYVSDALQRANVLYEQASLADLLYVLELGTTPELLDGAPQRIPDICLPGDLRLLSIHFTENTSCRPPRITDIDFATIDTRNFRANGEVLDLTGAVVSEAHYFVDGGHSKSHKRRFPNAPTIEAEIVETVQDLLRNSRSLNFEDDHPRCTGLVGLQVERNLKVLHSLGIRPKEIMPLLCIFDIHYLSHHPFFLDLEVERRDKEPTTLEKVHRTLPALWSAFACNGFNRLPKNTNSKEAHRALEVLLNMAWCASGADPAVTGLLRSRDWKLRREDLDRFLTRAQGYELDIASKKLKEERKKRAAGREAEAERAKRRRLNDGSAGGIANGPDEGDREEAKATAKREPAHREDAQQSANGSALEDKEEAQQTATPTSALQRMPRAPKAKDLGHISGLIQDWYARFENGKFGRDFPKPYPGSARFLAQEQKREADRAGYGWFRRRTLPPAAVL